ncbi:hypothetical protein HY029_01275 [Candidatus Gottesmanbacteria bacterium]|nr:hypothetical protein [Candidatus Gottesmanbacteria bacterium]
MVEVIPAILEIDFPEIEKKVHMVEGLVNWVQIDIADGTLVPNTTFIDPTSFTNLKTSIQLELHMMVKDPLRYLVNFHKAGFKRFFAHVEGDFVAEYIEKCFQLGVEVGLAIDGPTDFEKIHKYMDDIDCILVMAIQAGESGRPFREDTVEKIKKIRDVDFEIPIAVDGAMNDVNAAKVISAGATRINSNSFIFSATDVKMAIEKLKNISVIASEAKQSIDDSA